VDDDQCMFLTGFGHLSQHVYRPLPIQLTLLTLRRSFLGEAQTRTLRELANSEPISSSYLGFVSAIAVPSCWADSRITDNNGAGHRYTSESRLSKAPI